MAVGVTEVKTVGRLIFDLQRGDETTSRSIDIPYPKTDDTAELQTLVNTANAEYVTAATAYMNVFVQPASWRDTNTAEEQWTTTGVRYEIVETTTTPITPETPVTLGSAQEYQQENHEQQG